tara:strand:+ start:217 stop:576 length:360 start_codon:yes stop_codon:yes gene_type:complete
MSDFSKPNARRWTSSKFDSMGFDELLDEVKKWHEDRGLIEGSSDKDQCLKLMQELGELSDDICSDIYNDLTDSLGDMLVVMINIMIRNEISVKDCLRKALVEIQDRKGYNLDGVFIKTE